MNDNLRQHGASDKQWIEGCFVRPELSLEEMLRVAEELTKQIEALDVRMKELHRLNDGSFGAATEMTDGRWGRLG